MPDDKPIIESPVRVTADGTKPLEKLTDVACVFIERVVLPPSEAVAGLATDLVDLLRGPFKFLRLDNLRKVADWVAKLRTAQNVVDPKPLPPKATHTVIEQSSFVDDDRLRVLWAQMIVNAQAGMAFDDYLFEVLSKLNYLDVTMLQEAASKQGVDDGHLSPGGNASRLLSLGLVVEHYRVRSHGDNSSWYLDFECYALSELAYDLLDAVKEPKEKPVDTPGPDSGHQAARVAATLDSVSDE